MNKVTCDVLIFGAGIIGLSLALRLSQIGLNVIIVDNKNIIPDKVGKIPNTRVSAINYASVKFFEKINIWKNIPSQFYTSYHQLKTWEWSSAIVTFDSKSVGLSKMGCTVENDRLKLALLENFNCIKTIRSYYPYKLMSLYYGNDLIWRCTLNKNIKIYSSLLIGADGTNSKIRKKLGIGITQWSYHQSCMLLTIKTDTIKHGTIWQIFKPRGPIGFLPLYDCWGSLMWFDTPEYIHKLINLPISVLEHKIRNYFYQQLGKITLHNVSVIPIIGQCAHRYIGPGGAIVGDAAHTIHPLAGQGINLGIRDIINLSELLIHSGVFNTKKNILEKVLKSYHNNRLVDIYTMQFCINSLYFIFHNNYFPLKIARNIAFMTIEQFSYIKHQILKYAVGV